MKIFVATAEGQGKRKNDFHCCEEGEPVTFVSMECDGGTVDDKCGCRRCMSGIESRKGTTTFKVVDSPLTVPEFQALLEAGMSDWGELMTKEEFQEIIKCDVKQLLTLAAKFPTGMILEKRGNSIQERK